MLFGVLYFFLIVAVACYSLYANPKWKYYENCERYGNAGYRACLGVVAWIALILLGFAPFRRGLMLPTMIFWAFVILLLWKAYRGLVRDGCKPGYPTFLLFMASLGTWTRILFDFTLIGIPINMLVKEWAQGNFWGDLSEEADKATEEGLSRIFDETNRKSAERAENQRLAIEEPERASAFDACKKAADAGDVEAMYAMIGAYTYGEGVNKDEQEAFYWCGMAAGKGHVASMYLLGGMYEYGMGVNINLQEAYYWYKKAAEAGNPGAMYSLATLYLTGKGINRDFNEAYYWYKKAAEAGDADGMYGLATMYRSGYGIDKDMQKAFEWYRKAAEAGHSGAMYYMFVIYYNGDGVKKNEEEAYYWCKKAAEAGSAEAIDIMNKYS